VGSRNSLSKYTIAYWPSRVCKPPKGERRNMMVVDLTGSVSRVSPALRCFFPLSTTTTTAFFLLSFSSGSVGFFFCTLFLWSQRMIQSPSGTPACKTSLCKNEIDYQGRLSLQNKIFAAKTTNISFLKIVRILCSIPGPFFSWGLLFPNTSALIPMSATAGNSPCNYLSISAKLRHTIAYTHLLSYSLVQTSHCLFIFLT